MGINQNLEHTYKTFIDHEDPFEFFKGLARYLEYIFSVPTLKKEFDKQIAERRVLYNQIEMLEEKTRQEFNRTKIKLIALVKKTKVDIASFNRYQTCAFNEKSNILQELEAYENTDDTNNKPRAIGSVFISDEVERHLSDIAANLLKADHEKELKEFIVSPKEYSAYYYRINGSRQYTYTGNPNGNFIFSKTWPERWERVTNFERERVLKIWGSFEVLLQFDAAYKFATLENINLVLTPPSGTENKPWFGAAKERVKIFSMAQEIQRLAENRMDFYSMVAQNYKTRQNYELKNLKHIDLKTATETVHNRLLMIAGEESEKLVVHLTPDRYKISIKDREIWVNEYLIGKPQAVGSNFEFFDHIRSQTPHTKINRSELPSSNDLAIQKRVKDKSFSKILNGLGFKGEILKAFFYKRGKDTLTYRGDEITKEDLEKAGVRIPLFLKELGLAHTRNSPE